MRWFLSSELGTNCIEWANVLRLIFLWYALKAIMSQSYFNGPTTRSLNLQILYFSFLPFMEPLRAGWLFFLHTAATHCFTVVFSLSFQQFPFLSPLFSPALAQLMSCFQGSHWDTGDRYTWCTGSGQRGEGCVPNWGMTCKYQWSVAQTLYLCVKVMGMQRIFVWMHESYILMLHLTTQSMREITFVILASNPWTNLTDWLVLTFVDGNKCSQLTQSLSNEKTKEEVEPLEKGEGNMVVYQPVCHFHCSALLLSSSLFMWSLKMGSWSINGGRVGQTQ